MWDCGRTHKENMQVPHRKTEVRLKSAVRGQLLRRRTAPPYQQHFQFGFGCFSSGLDPAAFNFCTTEKHDSADVMKWHNLEEHVLCKDPFGKQADSSRHLYSEFVNLVNNIKLLSKTLHSLLWFEYLRDNCIYPHKNHLVKKASHRNVIMGSCALNFKDCANWKMCIWLSQWTTSLDRGWALSIISWTDDTLSWCEDNDNEQDGEMIAGVIISHLKKDVSEQLGTTECKIRNAEELC